MSKLFHRPPPKYGVQFVDAINTAQTDTIIQANSYNEQRPFMAKLISNERLTSEDHWQDVRLIRLDIEGSGIRYAYLCLKCVWVLILRIEYYLLFL